MNHVLMLTHNALELTKRAAVSVYCQDIPTWLHVYDNGSTDGTEEWLEKKGLALYHSETNSGVSRGWNYGIQTLFGSGADHCLVINNDVILPPWFYRELLSYRVPFVTGVSTDSMDAIKEVPPRSPLVGYPDFSAFLIRPEAWVNIGLFDEGMKFYAQDCDYHVRACKARVPLMAANLPFYHERSSTLKLSSPEERYEIERQANSDRYYFQRKWGFMVGSPEYQQATQTRAGEKVPFPGENGRF